MTSNQNHTFEDLDGIKCAIVEKQASSDRVAFLRKILEYNHYTIVVVASPPPKVAAAPKPPTIEALVAAPGPAVAVEETFTIGVTNVMFNATNAIFGRLLKLPGGHIVTLAYWQQKARESNDEVPYFDVTR
jgi:hypothetical protein